METFLSIGAWLLLSCIFLTVMIHYKRYEYVANGLLNYQGRVIALFTLVAVGYVIGTMKKHGSLLEWMVISIGSIAWLIAFICLARAKHNRRNLWLQLFTKGHFNNWR